MVSDLPKGFLIDKIEDYPGQIRSYEWSPTGKFHIVTSVGFFVWNDEQRKWYLILEGNDFNTVHWDSSNKWMAITSYPQASTEKSNRVNSKVEVYESSVSSLLYTIICDGVIFDINVRSLKNGHVALDIISEVNGLLIWDPINNSLKRAENQPLKNMLCLSENKKTGMLASGYESGEIVVEDGKSKSL